MNKVVFFLPVSLMILLFFFGYQYINNSETITNEMLENEIVVNLEQNRSGEMVTLKGSWDWTQMPIDGLAGNDYIFITVQKEDETFVSNEHYLLSELSLLKGDQVLQTFEGEIKSDGVIFTFPNKLVDHESYGNRGEITVELQLANEEFFTSIMYVHTWEDHENNFNQASTIQEVNFQEMLPIKHWLVKRF